MQILQDQQPKEHIIKTPALLNCVSGEIVFGNENEINETLHDGDYINIKPIIKP